MKVLYITSGFPYPLTSGYLRHFHLSRALAQAGHEVTLASLVASSTSADDVAAMREHLAEVIPARRGGPRAWRAVRRAVELGGGIAAGDVRTLARAIATRPEREPDVVVISGKRTAPLLDVIGSRVPIVVDLCDATTERLEGMVRSARGWRRRRLRLELRHVRRAERRLIERAGALLVASERDRSALVASGVDGNRLVVLPNGVDAAYWCRTTDRLGAGTVVMTGVMSYEPNADAAQTLQSLIMPAVRRDLPGARLEIVGRDPGSDLVNAAMDDPQTVVTGFIDDVRPHLEAASVFAAPLRFGAGIQNKVLEAMAMEVPVITSSMAAAGLAIDGAEPPLEAADDPRRFATLVADAIRAADRDPTPHRAGREYVTRHFTWERAGARLVELVEQAVAR